MDTIAIPYTVCLFLMEGVSLVICVLFINTTQYGPWKANSEWMQLRDMALYHGLGDMEAMNAEEVATLWKLLMRD